MEFIKEGEVYKHHINGMIWYQITPTKKLALSLCVAGVGTVLAECDEMHVLEGYAAEHKAKHFK